MKRIRAGAAAVVLALLLSACGGSVDESLLPTPVPTYGPERFAVQPGEEPAPEAAPEPVEEPGDEAADEDPVEEPDIDEADIDEAVEEDPVDEVAVDEEAIDDEVTEEEAVEDGLLPPPMPVTTPTPEEPADTEDVAAVEDEAVEEEIGEEEAVADPEPAPVPAEEPTDGDVSAEEASDEEAIDEDAVEEEAVDEEETGIHPDWEGLPDEILAAMEIADPDRGQQLTLAQGCIACHAMDPDQVMAGPTWYNMAEVARTRVEGESAGLYLYKSIIYPNDYIVTGYMPNIMLQIYDDILSDQETADMIAYLLTLEADE